LATAVTLDGKKAPSAHWWTRALRTQIVTRPGARAESGSRTKLTLLLPTETVTTSPHPSQTISRRMPVIVVQEPVLAPVGAYAPMSTGYEAADYRRTNQGVTYTGVPRGSSVASFAISVLGMRMLPCVTASPNEAASLLP
jgi:hypothetical protein